MTSQYVCNPSLFYKNPQSQSSACILAVHQNQLQIQQDSNPHESKQLHHVLFSYIFGSVLNESKNFPPLKERESSEDNLQETEPKLLTIKSKSSEDRISSEKVLPSLGLSRCESSDNFMKKPTGGRPRFMNSKLKPKSAEQDIGDIKDLLEKVPKICPQETLKIFLQFIKKGNENIKSFVDGIFLKAVNAEKRYQTTTFCEIIYFLLTSEDKSSCSKPKKDDTQKENDYTSVLKRCLLRKIQDIFEDQSLILLDKNEQNNANDLEKSLHRLLFLDFLKALCKKGILNAINIKNCLILLLVIFFNDNAKKTNFNVKNNQKNRKKELLEFRLDFTLEIILNFLAILFKSTGCKNHDENITRLKQEKYRFYEDFFCQAHEEQLIHNFSKDLLKIFNIFKEKYNVSWLIIKEIFTVNNDYLIIMENDIQKLKNRKCDLLEKIDQAESEKS